MLRILGGRRKLCNGLTRRDWLHVGGLGFLGVGLSDFLRLQKAQASRTPSSDDTTFGRAKSCILCAPPRFRWEGLT